MPSRQGLLAPRREAQRVLLGVRAHQAHGLPHGDAWERGHALGELVGGAHGGVPVLVDLVDHAQLQQGEGAHGPVGEREVRGHGRSHEVRQALRRAPDRRHESAVLRGSAVVAGKEHAPSGASDLAASGAGNGEARGAKADEEGPALHRMALHGLRARPALNVQGQGLHALAARAPVVHGGDDGLQRILRGKVIDLHDGATVLVKVQLRRRLRHAAERHGGEEAAGVRLHDVVRRLLRERDGLLGGGLGRGRLLLQHLGHGDHAGRERCPGLVALLLERGEGALRCGQAIVVLLLRLGRVGASERHLGASLAALVAGLLEELHRSLGGGKGVLARRLRLGDHERGGGLQRLLALDEVEDLAGHLLRRARLAQRAVDLVESAQGGRLALLVALRLVELCRLLRGLRRARGHAAGEGDVGDRE
mmetsp:Transcript_142551/g.443321  ORF Transcript_142551/g.443321 Transcript_142551/m.443321 type:complete len:421 (-) Transcript_142551:631-1893(-)